MAKRTYTSNVTAIWPIQKQHELLAASLPGWPKGYVLFHDDIDARQRRLRNPRVLAARNEMLRGTTLKRAETIDVPALPVFAMSIEDVFHALTLAGAQGATVHFLHEGLTVAPGSGAEALHEIAIMFAQAKLDGRAVTAGKASGDKKRFASEEKAKAVKPHYGDPNWTMKRLEQASGLTRNTIIRALGPLADARKAWAGREATAIANAKRAAAREKRKAKAEGGE